MAEIIAHFDGAIDPSRGFFLKPNIVFPVGPDSGEITRPKVVGALVNVLRHKYGDVPIAIGDGPAAGTIPSRNFEVSGYRGLARSLGVDLLDLHAADRIKVPWEYGSIYLPRIAFERVYINLPILKASSAAVLSGAIKNQKGLVAPKMKKTFHHMGLHGPLAALTNAVKPDLTILDGYNFFRDGNVFIAGDNVFEVDALAIRLLDSDEPLYFSILKKQGFGGASLEIHGDVLPVYGKGPHRAEKFKSILNLRLWSNPRACSLCRMSLHGIKKSSPGQMSTHSRKYLKLLWWAVSGADFVFGSKPEFEALSGRVVCIGDCTGKLAREKGYRHIPGCPPTADQILDHL